MSMATQPFHTLDGQELPGVRQLLVFLDNRLGQLLRLTQILESKSIRILGLSLVDSIDYGVVRLICDKPDEAQSLIREGGFANSMADVIVVRLSAGKHGLLSLWQCLLSSEINIAYCYALLPTSLDATIALSVDNIEVAMETLIRNEFDVLGEQDL